MQTNKQTQDRRELRETEFTLAGKMAFAPVRPVNNQGWTVGKNFFQQKKK